MYRLILSASSPHFSFSGDGILINLCLPKLFFRGPTREIKPRKTTQSQAFFLFICFFFPVSPCLTETLSTQQVTVTEPLPDCLPRPEAVRRERGDMEAWITPIW